MQGPDQTSEELEGGKRSRWLAHVKKTMKANKGKSLKAVLKMAKKTYTKTRRGTMKRGGGGLSPLPLNGAGRKRKGSRRH
jgi:hypothetical protein